MSGEISWGAFVAQTVLAAVLSAGAIGAVLNYLWLDC
ncbi:hypothetical protein J2X84_002257 [Pseudomonas corrugata]|nr:hypothetical protein [Pseudomonas corrugata]